MPESSLTGDLLSGECFFSQAVPQTTGFGFFFRKLKKKINLLPIYIFKLKYQELLSFWFAALVTRCALAEDANHEVADTEVQ